jgi:hypothetical protein
MGDSESEKLCARLTESVGDRPVDVFYKEFNLERPTVFAEFYFKEMMQIYHLPGMELWPKVMPSVSRTSKKQGRPPPQIYLSLVCFRPPGASSFNAAPASISKHRVKLACPMLAVDRFKNRLVCKIMSLLLIVLLKRLDDPFRLYLRVARTSLYKLYWQFSLELPRHFTSARH